MFKIIKQKLLNTGMVGRYVRYAIGEVILIVIGILVALSINNWNEKRHERNVVHGILTVVVNDIKQDKIEVQRILEFYNTKKATFLQIVGDSIAGNNIRECDICPKLISSRQLFAINKRGLNQLNESYDYTLSNQDTLVVDVVNFYANVTDQVENFNNLIDNDVVGNLSYWRDNYPWFARSLHGKLQAEDWSYFEGQEYKNKVAFHYVLIYENYLPILEAFARNSEIILGKIDRRLGEN